MGNFRTSEFCDVIAGEVMADVTNERAVPAIPSGDGPVIMPPLPPTMLITTEQQLKAIADSLRSRMLVILQHQPATVKQLADHLGAVPGTVAHHMQVLEAAGLVQIVARRLVHGIQAKYYARAARIFIFNVPHDVAGGLTVEVDFLTKAREELAEALATNGEDVCLASGFPHVRLTTERALHYQQRLDDLLSDLLNEPLDPAGQVYGLVLSFFKAPAALQPSDPE